MCEHKWIFQESYYKHEFGNFNDLYERIDTYFCEKCLEQKEIVAKHEYRRGKPYWYKS
ncbi:beta-glucosidase [Clostridium botulinum]|nr:beta-glucosidase [Clostridium botulinum]NFI58298.1 beta-glucosidase [Clostridium botulinum]NFK66134.1 beta-glucosidase [Clostridium botulinum]NFK69194.1 beta-glucosidase [Clostridium botulinum]NFK97543.1 beta-glucosidase [Clostridium botulinum]